MARILVVDDDALVRRKVRDCLVSEGHEVFLALDGSKGLVALQEHSPDLVSVDYIMPGLNGFQFCAAMTALPAYRTVPAILMSARTNHVGWRFIERFGVRDALHKPLNYEMLPIVVENVLRQTVKLGVWDGLGEESVRADYPIRDSFFLPGDRSDSHSGSGDQFPVVAMSGRLEAITISEVLQLVALQKRTGVLNVMQEDRAVSVQIRLGAVVYALAEGFGDEYRIGRLAVGRRLINRQEIEALLDSNMRDGLFGGKLVSLGHISRPQLDEILADQTREIIFELMRWESGDFRFLSGQEISQSRQIEALHDIGDLLMDGARQSDEWIRMRDSIPSLDVVFGSSESQNSEAEVQGSDRFIFDCIDGVRSVRTIADEMSMLPLHVCRTLHRFVEERRISRKS